MLKSLLNKIDSLFEKAEQIVEKSNRAIEELGVTVKEMKEIAHMHHTFVKEDPVLAVEEMEKDVSSVEDEKHKCISDQLRYAGLRYNPKEVDDPRIQQYKKELIRLCLAHETKTENKYAADRWQTGPAPKNSVPILGVFYGYPHVVIFDGDKWCLYGDLAEVMEIEPTMWAHINIVLPEE